ncbi:MAG TPA: translocation/assembly module TamB domain-containing protein, partial [Chitinophagaceae bacterium]|nr:translocation/assembly module TamB domain-containing protein [Chitinophagaceae bacterium]
TELEITENEIRLGNMKLRDSEGNTATVRGGITHKSFRNMVFDIVAEVDNNPMQLINTSYNDNQQFYGRAKGTGSLVLLGPQYDMNMYIEAVASDRDSAYITLPPSRSRVSGAAASFMVERKYGKEMTEREFQRSTSNITYEVNLTANPRVNIEVVLDDLTGDVIRGRGNGNLRLRAGTQEPLTMRGRYDIQEGSYLFTFQSFFKKPFVLRAGANNYIEWTGDPYTANIRFEAVYRAENVNFAPLGASLDLDNLQNYRGDVNVVATLTGELFKPTFTFKLEFPENITNNNPSLTFGIQQIENNQNEINKQVTYLIVFNSFAPYQTSFTSSLNELAYSTISGLLFGEVNKRLNQLLSKILRNDDVTFNFTGSVYNRNLIDRNTRGFDINQTDLNFSVGYPLFNDRVQITFGGTFDIPLESDIEQSIRLFPDVNISLLINKSGTVRATFFYTQTADPLIGGSNLNTLRTQRAGVKLSYRKEIESLSALFGKKKAKKKADAIPADSTRTDSTSTSQ